MKKHTIDLFVWFLALGLSSEAQAQLIAIEDSFAVPAAQQLVVETPGVLGNDLYNGEPAVNAGATAVLVTGPSTGVLECGSQPGLELCPDGSFTYTPGADYPGSVTFTYRVAVGVETAGSTATLTACGGGPAVFMCWVKTEYMTKLAELGFDSFDEGFEDNLAWGIARSPLSAPSVVSQGIGWETNHRALPAENEITTGGGPARTGLWGVYDPGHGSSTGTVAECDVTAPPEHCFFKDGVTGILQPGMRKLYGVGGFFTGSAMPYLVAILDGGTPIALGGASDLLHFYGVIDTRGFETFRFEETDGKVGQSRYVFADDFTIGVVLSEIFFDGFESGNLNPWSRSSP